MGTLREFLRKGEGPGHPFRGNQYRRGTSGAKKLPAHKDPATPDGRESADRNAAVITTGIREHVMDLVIGKEGDLKELYGLPDTGKDLRAQVRAKDKAERIEQLEDGDPALIDQQAELSRKLGEAVEAQSFNSTMLANQTDKIGDFEPVASGVGGGFENPLGNGLWGKDFGTIFETAFKGMMPASFDELSAPYIAEKLGTKEAWAEPQPHTGPSWPQQMVQHGRELAAQPDTDPNFKAMWAKLEATAKKLQADRERVREAREELAEFNYQHPEYSALSRHASLPMMADGFRHPTSGFPFNRVDDARKLVKQDIVDTVSKKLPGLYVRASDQREVQELLDGWATTSNDADERAARVQRLAAEEFGRPDAMRVNEEWRKGMYQRELSTQLLREVFQPRNQGFDLERQKEATSKANDFAEILTEGVAERGSRFFSHNPDDGAHMVHPKTKYDDPNLREYVSEAEWVTWAALGHSPKTFKDDYSSLDYVLANRIIREAQSLAGSHRHGEPLRALGDAKESSFMDQDTRKLLRATYDHTQETLKGMGLKPDDLVMLYRGAERPEKADVSIPWGEQTSTKRRENRNAIVAEPATHEVTTNPLSSWTFTPSVARRFGEDSTSFYSTAFRVKDIFSLSTTGPGCLVESEAVVLGGTYPTRIIEIES